MSPGPIRGLWALVATLEGRDAERARTEVRNSPITVARYNRAFLGYAEAVSWGRQRRFEEAAAAFAWADTEIGSYDWYRQLSRRLVAEEASKDGWGDPVGWLREAAEYFAASGYERIAGACRAGLRSLGAPVPRRGRGTTSVPPAWRAARVTSREMDVLTLLCELRNYKQVAARLYLSPRTVEKHVENLMTKLGVQTRAELLALAANYGIAYTK
jgi:DNA-binding CsgD family transcriptional regulator